MSHEEVPGSTPLDPDELEGLIPAGILTREDLNAWEQVGVRDAQLWARARRLSSERTLSTAFLRELHRRMFQRTWRWAGEYRRSDKNIGVHWPTIAVELEEALGDTRTWLDAESWPVSQIAARFHHRLVVIHPFPNGNGRWSRLATDALMRSLRAPRPNWGQSSSTNPRVEYLAALRHADRGQFDYLVVFIWS